MSETTKTPYTFTDGEKADIIAGLKDLAVAQAEFWDLLRAIETEHDGLEIETDIYLLGNLAGGCNHPPRARDLSDEWVWEEFEEHGKAEVQS